MKDFFDPSFFLQTESISPLKIKTIRKKFGLTQVDFAELIGVKYNTLCKWEMGTRNPSSAGHSLLNIANKHPEIFLENRKEIITNIMKYFGKEYKN